MKYLSRGYRNVGDYREERKTDYYQENYIDVPVVLYIAILAVDIRIYVRKGVYAGFMLGLKSEEKQTYSSSGGDICQFGVRGIVHSPI